MNEYLFFLSYSREHWRGGLLEEFLKDLEDAILGRLEVRPAGATYFLDQQDIEGGNRWRPTLVDALQSSRLILPIYAPGYFSRPVCGQEVEMFLRRQREANQEGYILPIYWIPPSSIPAATQELQYWWNDLPETYKTKGLEVIARKKNGLLRDDYEQCVVALATRVVAMLQQPPLPALYPKPSLEDVADAFSPARHVNAGGQAIAMLKPAMAVANGPDYVNFVLVAGAKTDFPALKKARDYYGARHLEWKPFTNQKLNIGALAQYLASSKNFTCGAPLVIDSDLLSLIAHAEQQNSILVILVDSWSLHLIDKYERLMRQADAEAARSLSTAVLVLWNEQDPDEAPPMPDVLRAQVRTTFPLQDTRDGIYFRAEVRSRGDFESMISESLIRIQDKIFQKIQNEGLVRQSPFKQKPALQNAAA